MTDEKLLARWESRSRKYWAEAWSGHYIATDDPLKLLRYAAWYRGRGCGGTIVADNDVDTIKVMENKIARGEFQPDANKTPLRRVGLTPD